ncbi:MAG: NADH-ubiquinone oxidoreductase chain [Labilithrix sp.]|nr:NADH-ubiquinone oxidoreductase chain [Labilithrix sp.]
MPRPTTFPTFFLLVLLAALLAGCERDGVPPLVEVTEIAPREIEVGDRIELQGAGFPQGRTARVTFRGTVHRPGEAPVTGVSVEAEGVVTGSDSIEVPVTERLEERFCGHGDHAAHTTMEGDLEVAFASSVPGAAPLVGTMHGMSLDITPSSVRASVVDARMGEGRRVLAYLGVTPGPASPRGIPIEKLEPGSPGERAGFQVGDLVAAVDGVHVREPSDVAPASARSAQITLRREGGGAEETKTVPMIGYAGARIPTEYLPALLLVGLALAVLLLLVLPAPAVASALELRVARRLRSAGPARLARALFGRGPRAAFSGLASLLVGTFALGPYVASADFDLVVLLAIALALLLGARMAGTGSALASLKAALDVGLAGLVLGAASVGVVVSGGALRLAEIVRAQGGAPWEFAAVRQPASAALAMAYVGALLVLLRGREDGALLAHARLDERAPDATARPASSPVTSREANGVLLERLGLLVASALGVALFFGGWQLPGVEVRGAPLQVLAAVLFVAKTWALCGALLGAAAIASPWSAQASRAFVLRRLVPALLAGVLLVALTRRLPPSESLEAALGVTLVAALVLLSLRAALRIRGAWRRPEPHASPFL